MDLDMSHYQFYMAGFDPHEIDIRHTPCGGRWTANISEGPVKTFADLVGDHRCDPSVVVALRAA